MSCNHKIYIGKIDNILLAAVLFDMIQIQIKGVKANCNFTYTKNEFLKVFNLKKCLLGEEQMANFQNKDKNIK